MRLRAFAVALLVVCCGTAGNFLVGIGSPQARERAAQPAPEAFDLEDATIADLLRDQQSGRRTARRIAEQYLSRIQTLDRNGPSLNSVIELNPDALAIADALDAERQASGLRGPLHGVPVLIKDNIDTADRMSTTAGIARARGLDRRPRRLHRRAPAGRRGSHSRQDEPERMGELSIDAFDERLERTRRSGAQSVRARSQSLRIELGNGGRRRREPCDGWRRHGDRRIDRLSVQRDVARWHQADGRAGEPVRHHTNRAQPGHRRADGPDGRRRRDAPQRSVRRRSARSSDDEPPPDGRQTTAHRWRGTACAVRASVWRARRSSATAR